MRLFVDSYGNVYGEFNYASGGRLLGRIDGKVSGNVLGGRGRAGAREGRASSCCRTTGRISWERGATSTGITGDWYGDFEGAIYRKRETDNGKAAVGALERGSHGGFCGSRAA